MNHLLYKYTLVFIAGLMTTSLITSCGGDDDDFDDEIVENDEEKSIWHTDAASIKKASSYYVGRWYYSSELAEYNSLKDTPNSKYFKEAITFCLVFNQDGTGEEIHYYHQSSSNGSSNPFTWKMTSTTGPEYNDDRITLSFRKADVKYIFLQAAKHCSDPLYPMARVYDKGEDSYRLDQNTEFFTKYTGPALKW